MKTMTCKQLGGPCETSFQAGNADEIIKAQDQHIKDMVAGGDESHQNALKEMQERWQDPAGGMEWYTGVKNLFVSLPED